MADRPIVCGVVALILGIVAAESLGAGVALLLVVAAVGVAAAAVVGRSKRAAFALRLAGIAAVVGAALYHDAATLSAAHPANHLMPGPVVVEGVARTAVAAGGGRHVFILEVSGAEQDGAWFDIEGPVVVVAVVRAGVTPGEGLTVTGDLRWTEPARSPREFDAQRFYRRRWQARQTLMADSIEPHAVSAPSFVARMASVREGLRERVHATMPRANRSLTSDLMLSTVIGLRSANIPEVLEADFRRAGTVHVLVVSGSQVGLIATITLLLTRRAGHRGRWLGLVLCVPAVVLYALLVGQEHSVHRAAVMGGLAALAFCAHRDYDILTALAIAVLMLVLVSPMAVFEIGLQLSVAAVVGIATLIPSRDKLTVPGRLPVSLAPRRRTLRGWLVLCLRVNLVAWLFTTPILLLHFGKASVSGILANLLVVPIAAALTILGGAACVLACLLPGWAWCLNYINSCLVEMMLRCTAVFSHVRWAVWEWGSFGVPHVIAWYALVWFADALLRSRREPPMPVGEPKSTPHAGSPP